MSIILPLTRNTKARSIAGKFVMKKRNGQVNYLILFKQNDLQMNLSKKFDIMSFPFAKYIDRISDTVKLPYLEH